MVFYCIHLRPATLSDGEYTHQQSEDNDENDDDAGPNWQIFRRLLTLAVEVLRRRVVTAKLALVFPAAELLAVWLVRQWTDEVAQDLTSRRIGPHL